MPAYRDIADFPGYRVGDDGSVWSVWIRGPKRKMIRGEAHCWHRLSTATKNGYPFVVLCKDGRRFNRYVHRLVLEAFNGECPPGHEGAHDNGIRSNCALSNLLWKTRPQNAADKVRHGTVARGERHGCSKLTAEDVSAIKSRRLSGETGAAIGRSYGINRNTVYSICDGHTWAHVS